VYVFSVWPYHTERVYFPCLYKSSESRGDKRKSINSLQATPSTRRVRCLTVACVAVMLSVAECESLSKHRSVSYV
jgi:hypothetical protein